MFSLSAAFAPTKDHHQAENISEIVPAAVVMGFINTDTFIG